VCVNADVTGIHRPSSTVLLLSDDTMQLLAPCLRHRPGTPQPKPRRLSNRLGLPGSSHSSESHHCSDDVYWRQGRNFTTKSDGNMGMGHVRTESGSRVLGRGPIPTSYGVWGAQRGLGNSPGASHLHSPRTDNHASSSSLNFFTGRMLCMTPNQRCQITEST